MIRTIIDTNVIVSGLISSKGPSHRMIEAWEEKRILTLVSKPILDEIREVLLRPSIRKYHHLTEDQVLKFCNQFKQFSTVIENPSKLTTLSIDPDDIKFLECALAGQAEFLVTGDKEVLELQKFKDTYIVNPATFIIRHHTCPVKL